MPAFLADMVAKGFWWALLASLIFGVPFSIVGLLLQIANKVLGVILRYVPSVFFFFYIWRIRGHVGWLIFAILGAIGAVIAIVGAIIAQKAIKQ